MAIILLLSLLLPITCVSARVDASTLNVHNVTCNTTTTSCECPNDADICVFSLQVKLRHSFTRYYIDSQNSEQAEMGRVYYFSDDDNDGNLYGHTGHDHDHCPNATEDNVTECSPPYLFDGSTFRPFIGINGQVPGPTLIVHEDQTVVVNVANELLMETVSIHWHGMYQYNTYFMDGVQHVTQCPISPHTSFRYIFKAKPSGTFWYHSHTGVQLSDGLYGGLIVKENTTKEEEIRDALQKKNESLEGYQDMPAEHTVVISDWYRENSIVAYSLLETTSYFYSHIGSEPPGRSDGIEGFSKGPDGQEAGNYEFWSALINGKGKHPDNKYSYLKSRLSVFNVDPDKVYRFRLIGAINIYAFRFSIDEHQLWVVGTDGHWVDPVKVDYIALQSGERYDFLLITKTSPPKCDYWMRAETLEIALQDDKTPTTLPYSLRLDHVAESILHYNITGQCSPPTSSNYEVIKNSSTPVSCICSEQQCRMMNCPWKIHSAYNLNCTYVDSLRLLLPSPEDILPKAVPDEEIFFQFGLEGVAGLSSVNGRRSRVPSVPPRLTVDSQEFQEIYDQEYCKDTDNPDLCYNVVQNTSNPDCWCVHMRNLTYKNSYRFVLTEAGPRGSFSHPIHLHGHSFYVVKIGLPDINETTGFLDCFSTDIKCTTNPPVERCAYVNNSELTYTCPATEWADGKKYTYPSATTDGNIPNTTNSNKIDPQTPRKDTIIVPAGGYAIIDIVADNPGIWFMHCHVESHLAEGMAVVFNEADPNQRPSPPEMRQCGNFEPAFQDFYDWLEFSPENPTATLTKTTTAAPTKPITTSIQQPKPKAAPPKRKATPPPPMTCKAAGFSSCCTQKGRGCYVSAGQCWCDRACHSYGNCCPDTEKICKRNGWGGWGLWGNKEVEEVQNELNQDTQMQAATPQPTGCAAAGHTGCCTGDNCKTDSGCYCDARCYYFHNCCDDIVSIGCYPSQRELFSIE